MSWFFEAKGYIRTHKRMEDTLPLDVPQEDLDRIEKINPGSATVAKDIFRRATEVAASGLVGPADGKFSIRVNGHVQKKPERGWSRNYVDIHISEVED